jgi:hypothetical protein
MSVRKYLSRSKLLRKGGTETSSDEGAAGKEKEQHEETETMNSTYPPFRPTEVSAVDCCARHFSKELVLARVSLLVVTVDHSSKVYVVGICIPHAGGRDVPIITAACFALCWSKATNHTVYLEQDPNNIG